MKIWIILQICIIVIGLAKDDTKSNTQRMFNNILRVLFIITGIILILQ